ncbi:hypothetical protein ACP70R_010263 [Stipagrostis hirtigluma subsp. patula]
MASPGEGARAVAVPHEGGQAAAGSREGERAAAGSGGAKRALSRSLDYPCTRRLRLRRLLAYLRRHSYTEVHQSAIRKMGVIFDIRGLVRQVKAGQLDDAYFYVDSFAPFDKSSREANLLALFLEYFMAINKFASGQVMAGRLVCTWFRSIYKSPVLAKHPCLATVVADVLFLRWQHARAFLDWQLVRNKAAELVKEMAYKTPELKDRLHYPRGRHNLYNVLPIGSSRRPVKNLGLKQSIDLAQFYFQMRKRLPSSQGNCYSARTEGETLIGLLESALEAGRCEVLKNGNPTEELYSSEEVFPLMEMLAIQVMPSLPSSKGQHSSKQDVSQNPAVVAPRETNPAKKRSSLQESHHGTHPRNDSKRPRTTENSGELLLEGRQAAAGSWEGKRAAVASSKVKRSLLQSLDYPCTRRLRLRRLLAYFWRHSYTEVHQSAIRKMGVIFDLRGLVKQVKSGQLDDAYFYVDSFAPFDKSSREANLLALFLEYFMAINKFASGQVMAGRLVCTWFRSIYKNPVLAKHPCLATVVADVLFLRWQHARAFLDWQLVRNKAAEMVKEMAYKTPELKDRLHYPRDRHNLYNIMRIGSSRFHRRCQVKHLGWKQPTDLAQFYFQLKKRLPSSQGVNEGNCYSGSARKEGEMLIEVFENALQAGLAGRCQVLKHDQPTECLYLSQEVFPLVQMLAIRRMPSLPSSQRHGPEHLSKHDMSQSRAAVASQGTNSAMKRSSFQESRRDTAHPRNVSKRPRTTGNFGEVQEGM